MKSKNYLKLIKDCSVIVVFTVLENFKSISIIAPFLKILFFLLIIYGIFKEKKNTITKFELCILIMCIYELIITMLNNNLNFSIAFSIISFGAIIIHYNRQLKKDTTFLLALYICFVLFILLTFISVIINIGKINDSTMFFVGGKNMLSIYFIPSIFYIIIYSYYKYNKITLFNKILLLISFFITITGGSGVGIVVSILSMILITFHKKYFISKKILYLTYIVLLFLILNSNYLFEISIIKDLIVNKLNKDITFTGRTYIWEYIIPYIKNNFFGYGRGYNIISLNFYGLAQCHNSFLELLISGGIPLLIMYIYLLNSCLNIKVNKNIKNILCIAYVIVLAYAIITLLESVEFKFQIWWLLLIVKNLNTIFKKEETIYD